MTQISCIYNLCHGHGDVKTAEQEGSIRHLGQSIKIGLNHICEDLNLKPRET